jgi:hypothetical protein
MNTTGMFSISFLEEATIDFLHRGVSDSDSMREQIAARSGLARGDQAWRQFVNHHAWALVRLQAQGRIRKIAARRYKLSAGVTDLTPPIQEGQPLPKWARVLVSVATDKNAKR